MARPLVASVSVMSLAKLSTDSEVKHFIFRLCEWERLRGS